MAVRCARQGGAPFCLPTLEHVRSQSGAQRPQDPLEIENAKIKRIIVTSQPPLNIGM